MTRVRALLAAALAGSLLLTVRKRRRSPGAALDAGVRTARRRLRR